MKATFKTLLLALILFVSLVSVTGVVNAADDNGDFYVPWILPFGDVVDFQINQVEINNIELSNTGVLYVERGEKVSVATYISGASNGEVADDVRVKAWIGGYEYDDIEDVSDIFETQPGVITKKVLFLEIPEDIEASKEYTLHVEVYDDNQETRKSYKLKIEEKRNELNIYDVVLNPGSSVKAGQPLFVSLRLENMGYKDEDNIKVEAKITELGVSYVEYLDELVTEYNSEDCDEDCTSTTSTSDMVLFIPANAASKDYTLEVVVSYNRGHSSTSMTKVVQVSGGTSVVDSDAKVLISAESTSAVAEDGKGAVYKLNLVNVGNEAATLTFGVSGVTGWGTYSVDPSTLTVSADSSASVNIYVSPNADATEGAKSFNVVVKDGAQVLSSQAFNLEVKGASGSDVAQKALLYVFLALLIILVLVAIVAIARKVGSKDSEPIEGQTYY